MKKQNRNGNLLKHNYKMLFLGFFIMINVVIFSESLTPATQSTEISTNFTNVFAGIIEFFSSNTADVIEPQSVSINGFNTIIIGESKRLTASVLPDNTTDQAIIWSSSNEEAAQITSGGIVVAYDFGFTTITATTSNNLVYSSIDIEVVNYPLPTSFDIVLSSDSIFIGTTSKVSVSNIEPAKASIDNISFSSSDESVARINEYGIVKGVGEGSAIITALSQSYSQMLDIIVSLSPEPIVDPTSLSITGDSLGYVYRNTQLTANFGIIMPTDQTITWISSNPLVATVDDTGLVYGTKIPGNVTIAAFCNVDITIGDTFEMTISSVQPIALMLSTTAVTVLAGKSLKITPSINPTDTTNKEIIWSCSNDDIARVSSAGDYGTAVALKAGIVTITAVSIMNENIRATISLEILKPNTLNEFDRAQLNNFLRKAVGHFALFFFDGLVGYYTFFLFLKKNDRIVLMISGGVGIAVGILSEVCQLFTEGRSCQISDMAVNSTGYVAAIFVFFLIIKTIIKRKFLKNNPKVV